MHIHARLDEHVACLASMSIVFRQHIKDKRSFRVLLFACRSIMTRTLETTSMHTRGYCLLGRSALLDWVSLVEHQLLNAISIGSASESMKCAVLCPAGADAEAALDKGVDVKLPSCWQEIFALSMQ